MTQKLPLVSVVLSFRNEELVIPELIRRLSAALTPLPIDFELIFVNDASTDRSLPILIEKSQADQRIKIINMSRRFGVSECVLAGMQFATGDAVVYLDADLQDPPELIPQLIEKWQAGADVVHTTRSKREGESALKLILTDTAYHFIGAWADIPLLSETGDFKLLSRRAVNELLQLQERTPYLRGLVSWVGFNQVSVAYTREARAAGVTKFPLFRNLLHDLGNLRGPVGTMIIGLTSFSLLPITIFLLFGSALCLMAFVLLLIFVIWALAQPSFAGWLWLLPVMLMLSGFQLIGIGVLGIYLGRVYQDVRGRPRYIVESKIGFGDTSQS